MMYILDTANVDKIKHCIENYPVDGVTTNPSIISKEHADFYDLIEMIKNVIGNRMFHIQVTGTTSDVMLKEANVLREIVGDTLYIKIPVSPEGLKATMELKRHGFNVTETAIFTPQQAMIAAKAGADFVAPYVNRLDNIVSDGVNVVSEIVEMFNVHNIQTKVLAANFKTVEQVHKIAMCGGHAVTVNPDLFENLIYHPLTQLAVDNFEKDWESVYADKKILDIIKTPKAEQ